MLRDPHAIASFQNMLYSIIALAETQSNKHQYIISRAVWLWSQAICSFAFTPVAILHGTLESCLNKPIAIKVQVSTDCPNFSSRLFHQQSDALNW